MKYMWWNQTRESESGEAFEVLLQLLFPITLILAFVVITELAALQNTSAGVANAERHEAIISLQEQLLLKAVSETFTKESEDLQLAHYEALMPSPDQILDGGTSPVFVVTTQKLYDEFGTSARKSQMIRRMHERSTQHYQELVAQYSTTHTGFTQNSLAELADITPENANKLEGMLSGEMDKLVQRATEPQLNLIGNWIRSERTTQESGPAIARVWQELQNAPAAEKQNISDKFVNLKIRELQKRMLDLKAPIQEDAIHDVL